MIDREFVRLSGSDGPTLLRSQAVAALQDLEGTHTRVWLVGGGSFIVNESLEVLQAKLDIFPC